MPSSHAVPADQTLSALALEARWHSAAVLVVLPMILAGWVVAAVLAFGLFEMGRVTAQRRHLLLRRPQPAEFSATQRAIAAR